MILRPIFINIKYTISTLQYISKKDTSCNKVGYVLFRNKKRKSLFTETSFFSYIPSEDYFFNSNCSVLVDWSQTSVGPKYWIGPGYT